MSVLKRNFVLVVVILTVSIVFDFVVFNAHHRTPPQGASFKEVFYFRPYTGEGRIYTAQALNLMNSLGLMRFDCEAHGIEDSKFFKELPFYRTAPAYPFLIGITYMIFGLGNYKALIFEQMILKSFVAVLIFLLFKLLKAKYGFQLSDIFGLMAAILYATWLPASVYVHYYPIFSHTLATFFVVLAIYLILLALGTRSYWRWILAGFVCALVTLTREALSFFPIFLLIGMLFCCSLTKEKVYVKAVIFIVVVVITIAPITIYNFVKYRKFIPVASSAFGWVQWADYAESRYGTGFNAASLVSSEERERIVYKKGYRMYDVEYQRYLLFKALKLYLTHPIAFLKGKLRYYYRLWVYGSPPPLDLPVLSSKFGENALISKIISILLCCPFLILAIIGIASYIRYWRLYMIIFSSLLYVLIVNMFFSFEFRFSLTAWPFIFLSTGLALNKIFMSREAKHGS